MHVSALQINAMGILLRALKHEKTFADCHADPKGFGQQGTF